MAVVVDVWDRDIWDFQVKSGTTGSCSLLSEPKMCHEEFLDKKFGGATRVRV